MVYHAPQSTSDIKLCLLLDAMFGWLVNPGSVSFTSAIRLHGMEEDKQHSHVQCSFLTTNLHNISRQMSVYRPKQFA